jgi:hypothetical protein
MRITSSGSRGPKLNPRGFVRYASKYVADLVHAVCEIEELRRWHRKVLDSASYDSREHAVRTLYEREQDALTRFTSSFDVGTAVKDPQLAKLLKQSLSVEALEGQTITLALGTLQVLDAQLRAAESRREAAIDRLYRLRAKHDRDLPGNSTRTIDGEALDITSNTEKERISDQRTQGRRKSA